MRIDADRLWVSLMELAKIGGTEKGGVCRIALTDLDRQGRDLFVSWAKGAGATIKVDQLGNIFTQREGRDPSKAPIMTGFRTSKAIRTTQIPCRNPQPGGRPSLTSAASSKFSARSRLSKISLPTTLKASSSARF